MKKRTEHRVRERGIKITEKREINRVYGGRRNKGRKRVKRRRIRYRVARIGLNSESQRG